MSDDLSNRGIYFDDIYVLRVLNPEITTETNDLKSDSTDYVERKCNTSQNNRFSYNQCHVVVLIVEQN